MRRCVLQISEQPRLADIKHLNWPENARARAEWSGPTIVEGFQCDARGRVISATAANVFAVCGGRLAMPRLDRYGIAGVARTQVLAWCGDYERRNLEMPELLQADEVFLGNLVCGIVPLTTLDERRWPVGPLATSLQWRWMSLFNEVAG